MDARQRLEITDIMADRGTSELESFFMSHDLGEAFSRPSEGWGRRKRVDEALLEAERRGTLDVILADAWRRFSPARSGAFPRKPAVRIRHDLLLLAGDVDSFTDWISSELGESWAKRFNGTLAYLREHVGENTAPGDFGFSPDDFSGTGKTVKHHAVGRLRRSIDLALELVPVGPVSSGTVSQSALANIHPAVRQSAEQLFLDGHTAAAILEAFKAVNNRVKQLTGVGIDGKALMAKAFDQDAPLLSVNTLQTPSDRDEQEGFKFLFMGAMLGIRNPKAHEQFSDLEIERALDYLSFASLLMRRLDDAQGLLRRGQND